MIVTITMNPSIDISYPLEQFQLNTVNRVNHVKKTAGGKGLNVTRTLKQLNTDVIASGLIGGFLGEQIKAQLNEQGIQHAFSRIAGETRNCIAILHDGKQTEILEKGPKITSEEAENFLKEFKQLVKKADILSFSGSLPEGLSKDFYIQMIKICNEQNKPVVLDCSGESLEYVLKGTEKPLLIKPNVEELSGLLNKKLPEDLNEFRSILDQPIFSGLEWIVVSMGGQWAFAKHQENFYQVKIPKIEVKNPVGSGDVTVAGLTYALSENKSDLEVLKIANTLGMLNAQEAETGGVNMDHFDDLSKQIEIIKF